jgi:hypothetical protein
MILFLAWQDPANRCWHPIGRLTFNDGLYQFVYVRGALEARRQCGFEPLQSFPDLDAVYESQELFPLFHNRVMEPARPDFRQYAEWLNLPADADDPLVFLARSGGRRATDALELFPCPQPNDDGQYHIHFFVHGLQYMSAGSLAEVESLKPGERLLLMRDFQNEYDPNALMLRSSGDEGRFAVGYCPRYLTADIFNLTGNCPDYPEVLVERVNLPPAPLQVRLLCNLTTCWPEGYAPFADEIYQPISSGVLA